MRTWRYAWDSELLINLHLLQSLAKSGYTFSATLLLILHNNTSQSLKWWPKLLASLFISPLCVTTFFFFFSGKKLWAEVSKSFLLAITLLSNYIVLAFYSLFIIVIDCLNHSWRYVSCASPRALFAAKLAWWTLIFMCFKSWQQSPVNYTFHGKVESMVLGAAIKKSTKENQGSWVGRSWIDIATGRKQEDRNQIRAVQRECLWSGRE